MGLVTVPLGILPTLPFDRIFTVQQAQLVPARKAWEIVREDGLYRTLLPSTLLRMGASVIDSMGKPVRDWLLSCPNALFGACSAAAFKGILSYPLHTIISAMESSTGRGTREIYGALGKRNLFIGWQFRLLQAILFNIVNFNVLQQTVKLERDEATTTERIIVEGFAVSLRFSGLSFGTLMESSRLRSIFGKCDDDETNNRLCSEPERMVSLIPRSCVLFVEIVPYCCHPNLHRISSEEVL